VRRARRRARQARKPGPAAKLDDTLSRDETRQRAATREELLCCCASGVPNRAARVEAVKAVVEGAGLLVDEQPVQFHRGAEARVEGGLYFSPLCRGPLVQRIRARRSSVRVLGRRRPPQQLAHGSHSVLLR